MTALIAIMGVAVSLFVGMLFGEVFASPGNQAPSCVFKYEFRRLSMKSVNGWVSCTNLGAVTDRSLPMSESLERYKCGETSILVHMERGWMGWSFKNNLVWVEAGPAQGYQCIKTVRALEGDVAP